MKTNFTKVMLAIIAFNLSLLTLSEFNIWPSTAHANEFSLDPSLNYGLVPVNEDGSVNVNISPTSSVLDVNLRTIMSLNPAMHKSYDIDGEDYYALDVYFNN